MKNKGIIIGFLIGLVVLLIIIVVMIGFLFNQKEETSERQQEVTDSPEVVVTNANEEPIFIKYGNFKSYDSVQSIITNFNPDYTSEEIEAEVLLYFFTLIRYEDYEDAYTFVATNVTAAYDFDYQYEDFVGDFKELWEVLGNPINLSYTVLEPRTPYNVTNNMGIHEKTTIKVSCDDAKAIYMTFIITEDNKLIPFDCLSIPTDVKYGILSAEDGQLTQDTYYEDILKDGGYE